MYVVILRRFEAVEEVVFERYFAFGEPLVRGVADECVESEREEHDDGAEGDGAGRALGVGRQQLFGAGDLHHRQHRIELQQRVTTCKKWYLVTFLAFCKH